MKADREKLQGKIKELEEQLAAGESNDGSGGEGQHDYEKLKRMVRVPEPAHT
jgi:hypothetical protein